MATHLSPRTIATLILSHRAGYRRDLCRSLSHYVDINVIGATEPLNTVAATCRSVGIAGVHPQVLILDGTGLAHHGIAMLAAWYGDMPELKTLLVCDIGDADMEEFIGHALCYGARGFISTACALEAYAKAIRVIVADDIWIGRKTLARVMIHFIRKWQERPEAVTEHWLQEHQAVDHPGALNQALESLTEREWQIIHLVAQGDTNKEIARQIEISDKTVKTHLRNIYHKLNIKRRMQLLLLEDWFHRC